MSENSKVAQFHLGMAEDGTRCLMVFIDDRNKAMECVADFDEFKAFISSLTEAAEEMEHRRAGGKPRPSTEDTKSLFGGAEPSPLSAVVTAPMEVSSAAFQTTPDGAFIMGALVSVDGGVVGIRMRNQVAGEISRDLMLAMPAPAITN